MNITLTVNGSTRRVTVHPGETLMEILRRDGFKGVKNGCAAGDCGSCAVLLDGRAVNSCFVFAAAAEGRAVTTVEGLEADGTLHPLQRAFLDDAAIQCGFCTPGMLMVAAELLARNPDPTEAEIREALAGNLCRCTGYVKPVQAIATAAWMLREARDG